MIQKSKNQSDQDKDKCDSTSEKTIFWGKPVVSFQDFINFISWDIGIYWNWLKYPIFYVVLNWKFFLTIPNFGCLSSSNSLLLMSSWESICALPPVPLILFQFKLLSWILLFLNTTLIRPVWSSNTSVVCGK